MGPYTKAERARLSSAVLNVAVNRPKAYIQSVLDQVDGRG